MKCQTLLPTVNLTHLLQKNTNFRIKFVIFSIFRVISDKSVASENPAAVKKVIFCTGKVYYDLAKARKDAGLESEIAISRVEQICPFPFDLGEICKYF